MKRDMDVVRRIALATEALQPNEQLRRLDGVDAHTFAMHAELMRQAGLVETRGLVGPEPIAMVLRLTWEGHDFLDAARSDTLWSKAKTSVIAPGASWTFDIVKDWLKEEIRQGLPTVRGLAQ